MGISRETFGQIKDILRKLDDSIDDVREKRLQENEQRLQDRNGPSPNGGNGHTADDDTPNGLDRRIG